MALKSIEFATVSRSPTHENPNRFTVDVYSDNGNIHAEFECASEADALALREAIRQHADRLRRVFMYYTD